MLRQLSLRACALACACIATNGSAQIVGLGFGPGIAFESVHAPNPATGEYFIENDGPFFFNPGAGAWQKTLLAPAGGWMPGTVYTIHEAITILPDPTGQSNPLTDWHERIELGSDGIIWDIWVGEPMVTVGTVPVPGLMTMFNPERTEVWFFFDPIDIEGNGIVLHIWKQFQFVGMQPMFDPVIITEYPTPAPASAALLALAGAVSARRRR